MTDSHCNPVKPASRSEAARGPFDRIIVIVASPLTLKLERDFYIRELLDAGFGVEYWNVAPLFHDLELVDTIEPDYARTIEDHAGLEARLYGNVADRVLYIVQVPLRYRYLRLFAALKRCSCVTAIFDRPGFPVPGAKRSPAYYLNRLIRAKTYLGILQSIIVRIAVRRDLLSLPDIVLAAGSVAMERNASVPRLVGIQHFDYDSYLAESVSGKQIVNGPYCVFLDEYLPYHADFRLLGMKTLDPGEYYRGLNAFFARIQAIGGRRVVIAVHPKAIYDRNPFGGRPLFKYRTMELVRGADFVIAHESTSISFAAIFRKPVVLVSSTEFRASYSHTLYLYMQKIASELGALMADVDEEPPSYDDIVASFEPANYTRYMWRYLASEEAPKETTATILCHEFAARALEAL